MIETLRREPYSIRDERVLEAMRRVPRDEFVPESWKHAAYDDRPLPIGCDQTISQPYIVAYMTEQLLTEPTGRILEIGTGSGYQAAVLAELVEHVFTIEIVSELAKRARDTFDRLGIKNISIRHADGAAGWPEEAPFDAAILTCAPSKLPDALFEQIREGGRIVYPEGNLEDQALFTLIREGGELKPERQFRVRFVPMTATVR